MFIEGTAFNSCVSVRYYNSVTGRWLAKDPSKFEGKDTNLYRYSRNDPFNLVDFNGKKAIGITCAVLSGAISAYQYYQSRKTALEIEKYQQEIVQFENEKTQAQFDLLKGNKTSSCGKDNEKIISEVNEVIPDVRADIKDALERQSDINQNALFFTSLATACVILSPI